MSAVQLTGLDNVIGNLKRCSLATIAQIVQDSEQIAGEMENHSKNTRPWTDRTGLARASIYGYVEMKNDKIVVYHGIRMEYGVYLELSNGGRYRVIGPTANLYRTIWKNKLRGSLRK